jgi:hypothetical protein
MIYFKLLQESQWELFKELKYKKRDLKDSEVIINPI